MGVYRRGSVWWISFVYKRGQIRRSTETMDKRTAAKTCHKAMTKIAEGKSSRWKRRITNGNVGDP